MKRYLRLYLNFLRFSFSRAMEFRVDFYFRIFMDLFYYTVNVLFFKLIYSYTDMLAGWNEEEIMVFVAIYLVIDGLYMTIFSNNIWWFPTLINRGDLDYYLIRPVNSLFMLSLREFAANSFVNLLLALSFFAWALYQYSEPFGIGQLLMLGFTTVNGTFLYYLVHLLFLIPVFWTHSGRGLGTVFFSLSRFLERPDAIFTGMVRVVLLTVLPFGLMASFPARFFLDGFEWQNFGFLVVTTAAYFLLVVLSWGIGLRAYSSASS